jgi:hypothetical protein
MRAWPAWLVISVALEACGHDPPPPPAAPKGPTACERASDAMVQTLLAQMTVKDGTTKDAMPTERADAIRNLIRARCEQDAWSADATSCLITMQTNADAERCARLMTEAQQTALVRDEQAKFAPQK